VPVRVVCSGAGTAEHAHSFHRGTCRSRKRIGGDREATARYFPAQTACTRASRPQFLR
jgi:hypothetical protein